MGTHQPNWLSSLTIPLFVARQSLAKRRALPRALGPWALDSGAFSEITLRGGWTVSPRQYANEVRRFREEIGGMQWAAVQDWMCEPFALQRTGLTVTDHQERTVASYLNLTEIAPTLPWVPVLQGWQPSDYLHHAEMYDRAGVALHTLPTVGLGSVCRRAQTDDIVGIVRQLAAQGIRLHGFGVKAQGLRVVAHNLVSADSLAWSFKARRLQKPLPGCVGHKNCANCPVYALQWRDDILETINEAYQQDLWRSLLSKSGGDADAR